MTQIWSPAAAQDVHLVMQICDTKSHQNLARVSGDDRTALSKKSIRSFLHSVHLAHQHRPQYRFQVCLVIDQPSTELRDYCGALVDHYVDMGFNINLCDLYPRHGLADSLQFCYQWMQDQAGGIVGQFQDDYLFYPQALTDCLDIQAQIQRESDSDALICHWHGAYNWKDQYLNRCTPRAVFTGARDYWIQIYDLTCSWLTTHRQFQQHWDLYNLFLAICRVGSQRIDMGLESQSLNKITTERGVLAVAPMRALSHHVQAQRDLDPHQSWQDLWDTINTGI